jgi:murein DD-endopeptidase
MHGFFKLPLTLIVLCVTISGTTLQAQGYRLSVDMRMLHQPESVAIGGRRMIYYELVLTNFSSDTIALQTLRVVTVRDSVLVASFTSEDLKKRFANIPTVATGNPDTLLLRPGAASILYIEIAGEKLTDPIRHVMEGTLLSRGKKSMIRIQDEGWTVKHTPIILGAPLRNGPWVAIYDPAWARGHRRVIYTMNGKARIPGRFAIDFMLLNDKGQYAKENEDVVANWYGYGADVLAVADGTVVTVRDDFQEVKTVSAHPAVPAEKATGNDIVLDIGNNHFAFYEHLKPGSIRVRPGQKIRKGDVVASLGFTGQTTGPHLHFHVADRNSPLGAEGIPFVFESFSQLGVYNDLSRMGQHRWDASGNSNGKKIANERPVPNAVVQFTK